MTTIEPINIDQRFSQITDYWSPKIAGEFNDCHVRLVKLKGEFVWHHHDQEDELFIVMKGTLTIRLRDRNLHLSEGEFIVIPRGVEHLPVAHEEVHVMLIEPKDTVNTGNVVNERTVKALGSV